MKLPATTKRVTLHSAEWKTRRIEREMERRIWYYQDHPQQIDQRLKELDDEWDIERVLETNATTLALTGLTLGTLVNRRFYLLPFLVTGFLLQHALQGWCPPVPLFRRIGIRTQSEIELERYALKALRGDFGPLAATVETQAGEPARDLPERALRAVRS